MANGMILSALIAPNKDGSRNLICNIWVRKERKRGREEERKRGREEERKRGREDERKRGREEERKRGREEDRTT
jgi:hypothetical protein